MLCDPGCLVGLSGKPAVWPPARLSVPKGQGTDAVLSHGRFDQVCGSLNLFSRLTGCRVAVESDDIDIALASERQPVSQPGATAKTAPLSAFNLGFIATCNTRTKNDSVRV